jgi:hypothetical protein
VGGIKKPVDGLGKRFAYPKQKKPSGYLRADDNF